MLLFLLCCPLFEPPCLLLRLQIYIKCQRGELEFFPDLEGRNKAIGGIEENLLVGVYASTQQGFLRDSPPLCSASLRRDQMFQSISTFTKF